MRSGCRATAFLCCLAMNLFPSSVFASITIMETATVFPSRPEKKLGHQLWKGSEYMGRLQFVRGNLQLCKNSQDPLHRFPITASMDGLPVAVYAKAGGCSLEEKALVASTLLDPPNIVGYLIVDDDGRGRKRKKREGPSSFMSFRGGSGEEGKDYYYYDELVDDRIDSLISGQDVGDTDEDVGIILEDLLAKVPQEPQRSFEMNSLSPLQVPADWTETKDTILSMDSSVNDDETVPPSSSVDLQREIPYDYLETDDASARGDEMFFALPLERFRVTMEENAWWSGGDEVPNDDGEQNVMGSGRQLKHHHPEADSINLAILHVSDRVGYDILDLLLKESSEIGRVGGTKILLNSKEPNATARTVFVWTMLSITVCASVCFCMLICVEFVGEEVRQAPPPTVRRRLTSNQVRDKFPAFHYLPQNNVEQQTLDDECAVCLDDFEEGMRLRKLPCGHVFHSTCIARWLIERSAVCPLCKFDLYEDEEEEAEGETEVADASRHLGAMQSFTDWLARMDGADAATRPRTNSPWWRRSGGTPGTRTIRGTTTGEAARAPTPPPARAFRWGFTSVPSPDTEHEGQEVAARRNPSTSTLASAWHSPRRWFGRNRRRGADANSMLTELTEPLVGSGGTTGTSTSSTSAGEEANGSSTPATTEVVSGSQEDGDAPDATEAESASSEPSPSSSPVEV